MDNDVDIPDTVEFRFLEALYLLNIIANYSWKYDKGNRVVDTVMTNRDEDTW